jgi:hypothetical protein
MCLEFNVSTVKINNNNENGVVVRLAVEWWNVSFSIWVSKCCGLNS